MCCVLTRGCSVYSVERGVYGVRCGVHRVFTMFPVDSVSLCTTVCTTVCSGLSVQCSIGLHMVFSGSIECALVSTM